MHFAAPIPVWLAAICALLLAGVAFLSYRRPLSPLTPGQRALLTTLRAVTLVGLLVFILRPIAVVPGRQGDVIVPVLVDVSRSMRVADGGSGSRYEAAVRAVQATLVPALTQRFTPELFTVGDTLTPTTLEQLKGTAPDLRHSNLQAAIEAVTERYKGRRVSGIVLLSDGGDTTQADDEGAPSLTTPVFAVGVGKAEGGHDREVLGVTAGVPQVDQASVDVRVSAVSHGYGQQPFAIEVRLNNRVVETRQVTPAADGSPVDQVFTVVPDPNVPGVVSVTIPAAADELASENNTRGVLVSPPARRRRLLTIQGAPGFEHSFLMRALGQDPGLDVDAVVRKGKNDEGKDTFVVQAGGNRAALLNAGLPLRKADLFAYDAIIIANLEGDFFTREQLDTLAEFVSVRGGGLLVLGGRSFAQRGLMNTALEAVMPVELTDRRGGFVRPPDGVERSAPRLTVMLTPEGEQHPVMRVGSTIEDTRNKWAALPPLAATAALGAARPGAKVLAVTMASGGMYPVVAVQQFGRGRSMVFGGESAWRWRMLRPAEDRSFEFFWRQAARWLAGPSPDPVSLTLPAVAEPGDTLALSIDARDRDFVPTSDATVEATITAPGGKPEPVPVRRDSSGAGTFVATAQVNAPGLHRVHVEARRANEVLGNVDRWLYAGGDDREFADPRLNEGVLRRLATNSGGRYVRLSELNDVVNWLESAVPQDAEPERHDLWQQPWTYGLILALLATEWVLRRRWGLR